jgi:hypothetical protein
MGMILTIFPLDVAAISQRKKKRDFAIRIWDESRGVSSFVFEGVENVAYCRIPPVSFLLTGSPKILTVEHLERFAREASSLIEMSFLLSDSGGRHEICDPR